MYRRAFRNGPGRMPWGWFWDAEGSWGEGICLHSDEDATRTSVWKRGKGEELGK